MEKERRRELMYASETAIVWRQRREGRRAKSRWEVPESPTNPTEKSSDKDGFVPGTVCKVAWIDIAEAYIALEDVVFEDAKEYLGNFDAGVGKLAVVWGGGGEVKAEGGGKWNLGAYKGFEDGKEEGGC